jgi:nucleotide-binding universal stress UspA family protein
VRVVAVIVVGIDGSEESKLGFRWALDEARLRGTSLRVVHAEQHEDRDAEGSAWLDRLVREVAGRRPGVEVARSVVQGPAAHVLVEEAKEAAMLVVGSRGHGGVAGLLLGSVSLQCVRDAACPVVVVRRPGEPALLPGARPAGEIVVGVDGSRPSKRALRFALEEARLRGASLQVVHAWKHATGGLYTYYTGGVGRQLGGPPRTREQEEQEWLARFVRCAVLGSDVPVVQRAVEGDPGHVLSEAAHGAALLVLGSRGWGGFTGLLLGSVGQHCVHHAPCPVVIVRGAGRIRQLAA